MERLAQVGDRIDSVTLYDVDGRRVELDSLLEKPLVVPLVRYYGCMPCQAFLRELEETREQLESIGLGVVGVGGAADYQARHLMDSGVGFPLLLDPDHRLYEALGLCRIHWWKLLSPFTWWKYLKAARRARQGRITGHPLQAPGLAIIDRDRTVRFLHRGETLGDYPSAGQLLEAARKNRS
jgi:peroxiredoxin